ncbi:26S proteasome regulatory complex, subunit RPN12/PSMD8 [Phaffia rhodozyma]|uniref:26S proteasome regulatory complex, subunit RPN12/PSMD8 n=1 Tax=Phaffia rhodozyma TaxID=264483 RepID=A0A0F7SUI7_PHARH|nr:26S proteasome regulatory complex, subunit RPN12/PSMD8 [Phaffia rhodozyma]
MSLQSSFNALKASFDANDLASVGQQLAPLKIQLVQHQLLFPSGSNHSEEDLITARSVLEIGAFHSIRTGKLPAFERYLAQLDAFYFSSLPPSPHRASLLALQLLALLSSSRTSAFHILLETIPPALQAEPDVKEVIELERGLMEGSYNKVWRMAASLIEKEKALAGIAVDSKDGGGLAVLADGLVGSIRNEISLSFLSSYKSLPISSAQQLLFFNSPSEVTAFAQRRGWTLSPSSSTIYFPAATSDAHGQGEGVKDLIDEALGYARELESIV